MSGDKREANDDSSCNTAAWEGEEWVWAAQSLSRKEVTQCSTHGLGNDKCKEVENNGVLELFVFQFFFYSFQSIGRVSTRVWIQEPGAGFKHKHKDSFAGVFSIIAQLHKYIFNLMMALDEKLRNHQSY